MYILGAWGKPHCYTDLLQGPEYLPKTMVPYSQYNFSLMDLKLLSIDIGNYLVDCYATYQGPPASKRS